MTNEPKYDEDVVNLGYLNRVIDNTEETINREYENVSRHYGSQPTPPYYKGDTWVDGNIVYTCINTRKIGTYQSSDWTTESGATELATKKNQVFLRQPSNYNAGDMWILQSDTDHRAGKKGEMLITTAGRAVYDEGDWVNMLAYGTIASINEVANNLNDAINRISVTEEAISDGIIITFYQATLPEAKHIGDLWYVTDTNEDYVKGKLYRYNGTDWQLLDDPDITKAFEEANEARLIADGKIQSFYSEEEPTKDVGVGDLWIDVNDNNKLYRYNGTNWIAVYDTRIDTLEINVETVTERVVTIETDQGRINQKVTEVTTRVGVVETDVTNLDSKVNNEVSNLQSQIDGQIQFWNGAEIPTTNNYPATEWSTEEAKNNHRADIYTVIEDIDGELKQGKSYRFDKVGINWVWVELTDNELSAVQALAQSKARVFTTTPKPPYNVGDLWIKDQELYECKTARDRNGVFAQSDWQKATKYTDDTIANLANITANSALDGVNNITTTQTTLEGTEIKIDDSAEEPILELELDGKSTQATRSGKNKFNIDILPSRIYSGGTFTQNTASISKYSVNENRIQATDAPLNNTLPGCKIDTSIDKTFTISFFTDLSTVAFYYAQYDSSGAVIVNQLSSNAKPNSDGYISKTFTFDNNSSYVNIGLGTDTVSTYYVENVQIEKGTVATEYEPYGASPSPEFPSEIQSVGDEGTVTIEQRGKNKLDLSKCTFINCTLNNDGTITSNINNNYYSEINTTELNEFIMKNKGMPITFSIKEMIENANISVVIRGTRTNGTTYQDVNKKNDNKCTATIADDFTKITGLSLRFNRKFTPFTDTTTTVSNLQVEIGKTATDYEPYFSKDYVIPLSAPLRSLPNGTKDTIEEDGIHRRVGSVVLDGSENWREYTNYSGEGKCYQIEKNDFALVPINSINYIHSYCSHFKNVFAVWGYTTSKIGTYSDHGTVHRKYFISDKETVSEWKTWLQQNPITLNYQLSEEVVEPFTEEQLEVLQSIETNLYTQYFNCDANMRITYVRNNGLADMYETKDSATRKYTETEQKIAELNIDVGGISATVGEVTTKLENNYMTTDQIEAETDTIKKDVDVIKKQQASVELTSKGLQVQIDSINNNGVKVVKNTLVDIGEEGIKVSKGSEFNSLLNDTGVYLKSYEKEIASYTKDGATMYNLTVQNEAIIGNLRALSVEVDGKKRTHIHWIGG